MILGIGASIPTNWEIQYLPYSEFLMDFLGKNHLEPKITQIANKEEKNVFLLHPFQLCSVILHWKDLLFEREKWQTFDMESAIHSNCIALGISQFAFMSIKQMPKASWQSCHLALKAIKKTRSWSSGNGLQVLVHKVTSIKVVCLQMICLMGIGVYWYPQDTGIHRYPWVSTTDALAPKLEQHTLNSLEQFSKNGICLPRWEGGGWVTISYFSTYMFYYIDQITIKSHHIAVWKN